MPNSICTTCGTQYAEAPAPPRRCAICEDERQYIGWQGQRWTTLDELRADHSNQIREEEPHLTGIGQQALLVRSPGGNVLWDCLLLIDDTTVEAVRSLPS